MIPYPDAFLRNIKLLLGDEYEPFLQSMNMPAESALRVNPLRENACAPEPAIDAVPWEPMGFYTPASFRPGADLSHLSGAYYMQDASAMAPVAALNPQPGERVLDLCAAPGGKAGQIAARLHHRGLLIANEPDAKRAKALSGNLERLGAANAMITSALPDTLAQKLPTFFDAVLVDAPCSGEGMFRRDEKARAEWTAAAPAGCAARQRGILKSATQMVAPGGRLAYSTCTFNEVENEQNIHWFLTEYPDFEPVDFALTGALASRGGMLRLWPHKIRGEGHFVALFCRKGERSSANEPLRAMKNRAVETAFSRLMEEALIQWPERFCDYDLRLDNDRLTAVPPGMPALSGVKILRGGLSLARVGKNHIEPDHALAMALRLSEAKRVAHLTSDQARRFARGEQLEYEGEKGWTLVTQENQPLGWGKASGGVLKNHVPKGIRWK